MQDPNQTPYDEPMTEEEMREVVRRLSEAKAMPTIRDVADATSASEDEVRRALAEVRAQSVPARTSPPPPTPPYDPSPAFEEFREVSYRRVGSGMPATVSTILVAVFAITFITVSFTIMSGTCAMQRSMENGPFGNHSTFPSKVNDNSDLPAYVREAIRKGD